MLKHSCESEGAKFQPFANCNCRNVVHLNLATVAKRVAPSLFFMFSFLSNCCRFRNCLRESTKTEITMPHIGDVVLIFCPLLFSVTSISRTKTIHCEGKKKNRIRANFFTTCAPVEASCISTPLLLQLSSRLRRNQIRSFQLKNSFDCAGFQMMFILQCGDKKCFCLLFELCGVSKQTNWNYAGTTVGLWSWRQYV